METAAQTLLPTALPAGAAHGDFGQSNVLVARDQRIFVVDTSAGWQVPVLEDLAYFLVGIECSRIQVLTGGMAFSAGQMAVARRAFLEGYFAQEAVPEGLALYETLLVLDRWVAQLGKLDGGVRSGVKRRMVNTWFRRHSARVLGRLG
jgi:Ser/Thr protein kinase RdoA (MazF antagonist)